MKEPYYLTSKILELF